ncbi:MAG: hypothetical protein ACK4Q5_13935 [Saprospiraceae bacterium]
MTTLFSNWHFMRLLRAGIAVWAFAEAWRTGQWILLMPGSIFALQAIFDVGCCGPAGCAPTRQTRAADKSGEEITYEEIR